MAWQQGLAAAASWVLVLLLLLLHGVEADRLAPDGRPLRCIAAGRCCWTSACGTTQRRPLLPRDPGCPCRVQDRFEELRARRRRLLSAAQSARIRRGMIRYVQVVLDLSRAASLSGGQEAGRSERGSRGRVERGGRKEGMSEERNWKKSKQGTQPLLPCLAPLPSRPTHHALPARSYLAAVPQTCAPCVPPSCRACCSSLCAPSSTRTR